MLVGELLILCHPRSREADTHLSESFTHPWNQGVRFVGGHVSEQAEMQVAGLCMDVQGEDGFSRCGGFDDTERM